MTDSSDGGSADDRTALAKAVEWATIVMTISIEMVIPGLIGVWLDGWLGSVVAFTLLGFAGGLTLAIWHLMRLLKSATDKSDSRNRRKP